jgi:hypothetical protein
LFITVFGTGIIEVFLLILVGGVLRSAFLLIVQSKTAMILALLLIGGFPAVRWFRLRSLRRRFRKKVERTVEERGHGICWEKKFFRNGFSCSCQREFTVETKNYVYVGMLLPIHSVRATLYLTQKGYYRFEKRFFWWWLFYPKHRLETKIEEGVKTEKSIKKSLILTKEPLRIRSGDEDFSRSVDCGDSVCAFTLYTPDSFCNELDRIDRLFR